MSPLRKTTKAKAQSAAAKSPDELMASLVSIQGELLETRRSLASRELANTAKIKELRKEIARVKTLLNNPRQPKEKA